MHSVFLILGGERLKESYMTVFRNGRKNGAGRFTEHERNMYLECFERMENLIFLTGYLLHYHFPRVKEEDVKHLYELAVAIDRFKPYEPAELIEYEIDSGLLENLYFFIEYYYFR